MVPSASPQYFAFAFKFVCDTGVEHISDTGGSALKILFAGFTTFAKFSAPFQHWNQPNFVWINVKQSNLT